MCFPTGVLCRALCAPVQLATPPAYRQRELFNYRRYLNGGDCLSVDVFDQAGMLAMVPGLLGASWGSSHRVPQLAPCPGGQGAAGLG